MCLVPVYRNKHLILNSLEVGGFKTSFNVAVIVFYGGQNTC